MINARARPCEAEAIRSARGLAPCTQVQQRWVLAALRALPGCLLARMSGSGATCFGLFADPAVARAAAARLPGGWWRDAGGLYGGAA